MKHQLILVLDFNSQYSQLIARRVRSFGVYCEVSPHTLKAEDIAAKKPVGIILAGGHDSALEPDAPKADPKIYQLGIPILGVGYGAHIMALQLGGGVSASTLAEQGSVQLEISASESGLLADIPREQDVWISHSDIADRLPEGFSGTARTVTVPYAAFENAAKKLYGVQFHPESEQTKHGKAVLRRFLFGICGATGDWSMEDYAKTIIAQTREQVGDGKVLLALSGGVDSSVVAAILSQAVGDQLTCIFVDHGLMRKNEGDEVEAAFSSRNLNFLRVNAGQRFLDKLSGVTEPEKKRKIIGEEFIRVFEQEAKKIGKVDFLAQGTIYPDVIESGIKGSAVIKSHHNVGGLPQHVDFKEIIEPLRMLFKDEVRALGNTLGLPDYLVQRQPFPGPGLAIRVIGEVTEQRLSILRDADFIYREEIAKASLDRSINQYFAVLTDMRSVGMTGDRRTYDYILALRGVTTGDFMTADWAKIPHEVLERVSTRIINEVEGVNRVVYDITSKPPATIEWE